MIAKPTKASEVFNEEELLSGFEIQDWNLKTFATEIYGNIGQILSLAKLQIAAINPDKKEEIQQAVQSSDLLLEKAIKDLRKLAKMLTPAEIIQKGFAISLSGELDKLNKLDLCNVHLAMEGTPFRLQDVRELVLFSIIQHYIMKALYTEEVREMSVNITFKVSAIHCRITYIENERIKMASQKPKGVGIYRRAKLIGAQIKMKKKKFIREISLNIKKQTS